MGWKLSEPKYGDIIRIEINSTYHHYGIYVSDDEVIEFGRSNDMLNKKKEEIEVLKTSIKEFSNNKFVETRSYNLKELLIKNKPNKVVELARGRIGEKGYDILNNNCEHFVYECVFNKHLSFNK